MFNPERFDTHRFGNDPNRWTSANTITSGYIRLGEDDNTPIEVNVAGYERDEIEVTQDGPSVVVSCENEKSEYTRNVHVGNKTVSKATYKAGMLTLHFEDTSKTIPVE